MMSNEEFINNAGFEDAVFFSNPSYDEAIIGVSHDGRVVYDYDKMLNCLMKKEGWELNEAIEWIEYNAIRSLPYYKNAPIIITTMEYL